MINKHTNFASQDDSPEEGSLENQRAGASAAFSAKNTPQQQEVLVRKRKRRKNKRKKHLVVALVIILVLALVVATAAWAVNNAISSGERAIQETTENAQVETIDTAVTYDEGKTVTYNGHTYELNTDMVSIAFIGYDREAPAAEGEKPGQSDVVMVMALDTKTGETTAISVPRDTMTTVDIYLDGSYAGSQVEQLCLAYSYGDGGASSCENTVRAVSRVLYNIPVTYYYSLDLSGIGALNDAIGGVSLTPLQSIPQTNIVEGEPTVLFGSNARRYVQYRDTSILTSPLDRQARQMQYVKAFASQALGAAKGDVSTLMGLYTTAQEYSVTNLGVNEFGYLATSVVSSGVGDISITSLEGTMEQGDIYAEYYLDDTATYETVLNTYYRQVS